MTNDPQACANCHVMNEQYDGWIKSSHRSVAVCNDCHVPHNVVAKYATKASNGFWHSYYFTTGSFPEPIRALPASRAIAEVNCRRCLTIVTAMGTPHTPALAHLVSAVTIRGPYATPRPTLRVREVNRVRSETAECG
jgi:cytochrome c nitrite reductase small subunit